MGLIYQPLKSHSAAHPVVWMGKSKGHFEPDLALGAEIIITA